MKNKKDNCDCAGHRMQINDLVQCYQWHADEAKYHLNEMIKLKLKLEKLVLKLKK